MQTFRILYLHQNALEHTETIQAGDILEAIESASLSRRPECTAEIWSDKGKVGVVGPSLLSSVLGAE